MMKVLFFIHDLGPGGAEKVLVNLVNHMDRTKFDITVIALFGGGVNEQFLAEHVHYRAVFTRMIPGNSHLMKLFSPEALHRMFIREHYDVEIAYLEGPDARIISGCQHAETRRLAWIHSMQMTEKQVSASFRSFGETMDCYQRFDRIVCVSHTVAEQFSSVLPALGRPEVIYNTNDSEMILRMAAEAVDDACFSETEFKLVGIGKLVPVKGFDRLVRISSRLRAENYPIHLYLLGEGPEKEKLKQCVKEQRMDNAVTFLGYQTNPYRYLAHCDLFVCSSYSEGFSTAATEALIVGTPVCTTEVSGMKELLGESNEYGVIVDNNEEALYEGIKRFVKDTSLQSHYKQKASERGRCFHTEPSVKAVEDMLEKELLSR